MQGVENLQRLGLWYGGHRATPQIARHALDRQPTAALRCRQASSKPSATQRNQVSAMPLRPALAAQG